MKRLKYIWLIFFLAICVFVPKLGVVNTASAEQSETFSKTIEVDSSIEYDSTTLKFSSSLDVGFHIQNNATLTLKNVAIDMIDDAPENISIQTIFSVESAGTLILENVQISSSIRTTTCINNKGKVVVNSCNFTGRTSVENNSTAEDSLVIISCETATIKLNSGYVTVCDSTTIGQKLNITVPNPVDNKLVVKGMGENVFANKFLGNIDCTIENNSSSKPYYLDYVADGIIDEPTDEGYAINTGDIILTKKTSEIIPADDLKKKTAIAGKYCTADNFLKENLENEDYTLYSTNGKALNNFEKLDEQCVVTKTPSEKINLTVKSKTLDGEQSTHTYSLLSGQDIAVFVDIPSEHILDSVEVLENNNKSSQAFTILESDRLANDYYFRQIIRSSSNEISGGDYTVSFNFVPKPKLEVASVNIEKSDDIELLCDDTMYIGIECKCEILKDDSYKVMDITFNSEDVEFETLEDRYTFSITPIDSQNELVIDSVSFPFYVNVEPKEFTFEYGSVVDLSETINIVETGESILVQYQYEHAENVGKYKITGVTCDNPNYIVNLSNSSEYFYTIAPKMVSISECIEIQEVQITYALKYHLEAEYFIKSKADFVKILGLNDLKTLSVGRNELKLYVDVSSENYKLSDYLGYVIVVVNVVPYKISSNEIKLANLSKTYTGMSITPDIVTDIVDENLKLETTFSFTSKAKSGALNQVVNCGTYLVSASVKSICDCYEIDTVLSGKFTITPISIDTDEFRELVEFQQITYDGLTHSPVITGENFTLSHATASLDGNPTFKDAGEYDYTVKMIYDDNYTGVSKIECKYVINPKEITVILNKTTYTYSDGTLVLDYTVNGTIDGESVVVYFEGIENANTVGSHTLNISSISSKNYSCKTKSVTFKVVKSDVDVSGLAFEDVTAVYDGNKHLPQLVGNVPEGITYTIDTKPDCKNVGEYTVKCTFSGDKDKYTIPEPLYAKVTITPRPIKLIFGEPESLKYDGTRKNITVIFTGQVDGETIDFSLTYSDTPVLPGRYTCTVTLKNANYTLDTSNTFEFYILSDSLGFQDDDYNLRVDGEFLPTESVNVSDMERTPALISALNSIEYKSYKAISINFSNPSNEPCKITMNCPISGAKHLRVFKLDGNTLVEIDCTLNTGTLSFELSGSANLVFVEEKSAIDNALPLIYVISAFAVLLIICIITFVCIHHVKSKKLKHY